jgi:hypothetical protein
MVFARMNTYTITASSPNKIALIWIRAHRRPAFLRWRGACRLKAGSSSCLGAARAFTASPGAAGAVLAAGDVTGSTQSP